jgi:F-type H+-transporting ATPase subunit gamma
VSEALVDLEKRVESLAGLRSVVRTMKALSAASIRPYEAAVEALGDYARTVELALHVVVRETDAGPGPADPGEAATAAVIFGSDHGLCGRFNEEIAAFAEAHLERAGIARADRRFVAVGARVADRLARTGSEPERTFPLPGSAAGVAATVQRLLLQVDAWQTGDGTARALLFYNRHLGGSRFRPTAHALLPIDLRRFRSLPEGRWPSRSLPTFSMPADRLLGRLLRQWMFVSLFRACAESQASEHGSRLAAMQAAQRNLEERGETLRRALRRARQEAVTAELMDVLSGFEATEPEGSDAEDGTSTGAREAR